MFEFVSLFHYAAVIILMMSGFYIVIDSPNLIKKMVGLNIFQAAVFVLYITMGKISGGSAPIISNTVQVYSNPLPHVLILTAIVVGVATTALGLALIVRIHAAYGSVDERTIAATEAKMATAESAKTTQDLTP